MQFVTSLRQVRVKKSDSREFEMSLSANGNQVLENQNPNPPFALNFVEFASVRVFTMFCAVCRFERFDLAQDMLCASHGFSETIAISTSSLSEVQISNDSFVYELQPRISMLRGRGSSTVYSALMRPGLALSSTTRSDI